VLELELRSSFSHDLLDVLTDFLIHVGGLDGPYLPDVLVLPLGITVNLASLRGYQTIMSGIALTILSLAMSCLVFLGPLDLTLCHYR
jgi:hypothetical protein